MFDDLEFGLCCLLFQTKVLEISQLNFFFFINKLNFCPMSFILGTPKFQQTLLKPKHC